MLGVNFEGSSRFSMQVLHQHSLVIVPSTLLWISLHFFIYTSLKYSWFHPSLPWSIIYVSMSSVVDKGGSSYKMLKGSMVGFIKRFRIRFFMSMLHKHSLVIIPFFNLWISLHFSAITSLKSSQFHLSLPWSKTIHEHTPSLVEKGGSSYKKLIGSMVEFMEGSMYKQEYYFVRERWNFSDVPSLCYCFHCSKKKKLWMSVADIISSFTFSYFALINLHYGFFFLRRNACMIHAIGWIQYTAAVMIWWMWSQM